MARQDFLSEFVLRELLAALGSPLDAPTNAAPADSFSESLSEESESQNVSTAANGRQSRVMLVRRTNSSQQRVTLVDRHFDVQAFVPKHVMDFLQQTRGFQTLGRLRGSVVRVTKYHFATLGRCLEGSNTGTSVSLSNGSKDRTRVYLYVDALAIVEENDLAADPKPEVYSHSLVQERLETLSEAELEKQLMIHQGLTPFRGVDRFDDERPLLEEDCVIPEEQEQELEEDGWGLPTTVERRTDSELIDENGSVLESQVVRGPASQDELSTQDVTLSGNPSVGMRDESVKSSMDSQIYPFQQENIQDTFIVGSDTEDEDDGLETQKATPSTQKYQELSARSSPATPTTLITTQNSGIIDLTRDSTEKAVPESLQRSVLDQEPKIEVDGLEENVGGAVLATQATPLESQKTGTQTRAKGWGTLLRNLASNLLGTPSGEDSNEVSQPPESESDESDEPATQLLDQPEEEKQSKESKESKYAEPEEFVSSQATVMLEYSIDNDENANAFEYEAEEADSANDRTLTQEADSANDRTLTQEADSASGRTLTQDGVEADSANDRTLTQDWADTVSPQKKATSRGDNPEFKTPSPSAQVTPGTEKRAEVTECQKSAVSTANPVDSAHGHPASAPNSQEPVLPSAKLSPAKSPSNLVISVGSAGNRSGRTGPSVAEPRGLKRRHQQTRSKKQLPIATSTQEVGVASVPRPQTHTTGTADDHSRPKTQKRRRREIQASFDDESQLPQFEQAAAPPLPRRRLQPDPWNVVDGIYSLDAICQSLGSHPRDDHAAESNQERSSRQSRRAWKRYEHLFPPLNMARVEQMLAEQARASDM